MRSPEPALSVVVVTKDVYQTLRPVVTALGRQTIADRIELVVVAPAAARGAVPRSDAVAFHSVQVVEVGPVSNRGRAAAHGVAAARAPIIALTENHCFPDPDWAELTLEIYREGPWAAVGPSVQNGNPERFRSRAMHSFGYGRFPRTGAAGPMEELPLHNSSFRREVLQMPIAELEQLLGNERRLHRRLHDEGKVLYFDPRATKWHLSEATWRLLTGMWFCGGRGYGAGRTRGWPSWKRAIYAAAAPLLTFPIAANVWKRLDTADPLPRTLGLGLVVLAGSACHAAGEFLSYVGVVRTEFPFVEAEEFMIRERLGGTALRIPHVAALVRELDRIPEAQ